MTINFVLFWITMLKDPGVPESVYLHYIKVIYRQKMDFDEIKTNKEEDAAINHDPNINDIVENTDNEEMSAMVQ